MTLYNNKISVVIPVHNGADTLRDCLESFSGQTRPEDELIVVDNASTDRTREIIEDFATRHASVRYVFEGQLGRGRARNAGLRAARGDIIAMTDADCVVPNDWLEKIVRPIEEEKETVVMGFEEDGVQNYWSQHRQAAELKFLQSKSHAGYINVLDTKNFAIRADILRRLEFNPLLKACEDLDLCLRLKKEGFAIRFLPEVRVRHQHVASFRKLAVTQFTYSRYSQAIIQRYRDDAALRAYLPIPEHAERSPGRRFLSLLMWSIDEIVHRPQDAPYILTEEWAWKIGACSHWIRGIRLNAPDATRPPHVSDH